jgi:TetR/AcrR family tetracycline transcriptional repressor
LYSCQVVSDKLTRSTVAERALRLADAEGLEAVTIRRLAQELGVTPMALYWHFKNKDELLAGMADRVWSLVDSTPDPALPWLEQLRALMRSLVDVLRAHPAVTPVLISTDAERAQACFHTMETALGILYQGGFSPREGADLCTHGLRTAIGLVGSEQESGFAAEDPDVEEQLRRKRITLRSLPPDRYPNVIAAAEPLTSCDDPERYYDFGIDLFIAGVAALAAKPRRDQAHS